VTNAPKLLCPECGNAAEIRVRSRGMNMGSAQIRCPYNHFHYGTSFHSGSEKWARDHLIEKWNEMVNAGGGKVSL